MKECSTCHLHQDESEYYKDSSRVSGLDYCCKTCCKVREHTYHNTFEGFFQQLLKSAKGDAKKRLAKGRSAAGVCTLTKDDLLDMWRQQKGCCYYSKLPMTARPKSQWQCSLERLDPDGGYTVDNCVLCCLEFNAPSQWRADKVMALLNIQPDVDAARILEGKRTLLNPRKRKRVTTAENEHQQLIECSEYWPIGHLRQLLGHAKGNTAARNGRGRELEFDIDLEFLKEQYIRQQGRCYYSDMVMSIGGERRRDWMVSLERLDPKIGYIKSNTVIIGHEFNSTYVNWSREKVEIVRQSISSSHTTL